MHAPHAEPLRGLADSGEAGAPVSAAQAAAKFPSFLRASLLFPCHHVRRVTKPRNHVKRFGYFFSAMKLDPEKVRDARHKSGLKTAQLAKKLGVSRPYISMLETGKKPYLDQSRLSDLCSALGCNLSALVTSDHPTPGPAASAGFQGSDAAGASPSAPSASPPESSSASRSLRLGVSSGAAAEARGSVGERLADLRDRIARMEAALARIEAVLRTRGRKTEHGRRNGQGGG